MKIAYVHGFNSSPRSFNYMLEMLPEHDSVLVRYDSHDSLENILLTVNRQVPKGSTVIGHSLGGIIGAIIAERYPSKVSRLVTASTPFGGSRMATMARWIPGHPRIVDDITPSSPHIEKIKKMSLDIPTLNIITTGGSLPTSPQANDSVVTVASQKALRFGKKVTIDANHFEVMLHEKTIDHVSGFVFEGN